jgi:murein DD-endopeptidase MepM/ murein hydrolase activator NlpD
VALGLGICALVAILILAKNGHVPRVPLPPPEPQIVITTGTVREGDVFAVMLAHSGVPALNIPQVERAMSKLYDLRKIQPGHIFEVVTSTDGVLQKFVYRTDPTHAYTVVRSSNAFEGSEENLDTYWKEKRVSVTVTRFLEADLRSAGYDARLIDNLTSELSDRIFGWRLDFFTEQRVGDKLDVLLEEEYIVGQNQPLPGGRHMRVIAASYTGSGTRHKDNIAVRFQVPGSKHPDFYDPDGNAMQRQFLRAPFTKANFRVSSGFNLHRFHPILRIYRPHHGTDYAATTGTPVAAIGKGVVVRAGWYKGYGKCVDIKHNGTYTSRYGHLSAIAVKLGHSVEQGEFIGRVGSTGLATGPHLHFEMLVNGEQKNFLAMSFPAAASIPASVLPEFRRVRDTELARLNGTQSLSAPSPNNKSK